MVAISLKTHVTRYEEQVPSTPIRNWIVFRLTIITKKTVLRVPVLYYEVVGIMFPYDEVHNSW